MHTSKLQKHGSEDKSMTFKDASTGEIIRLVLRRFASINSVVVWVDSVVVERCTIKKTAGVSGKSLDNLNFYSLTGFDVV